MIIIFRVSVLNNAVFGFFLKKWNFVLEKLKRVQKNKKSYCVVFPGFSHSQKHTRSPPPHFLSPNRQLPGGSGEKREEAGEMIKRKVVPEVVVREPQSDETAKKQKNKQNKTTLRERKRKNSIMVIQKTTKIFFCILVYIYTAIPLSNIFSNNNNNNEKMRNMTHTHIITIIPKSKRRKEGENNDDE